MATSLFSALFLYAKDSRLGAVENYTTEALAGAIRLVPEPFISWLVEENVLPMGSTYEKVETQRAEPEGILDLVLHTSGSEKPHRLIVEVKVDAGQSGDQMRRYGQVVQRWVDEGHECPQPVVLSREPIDRVHRHISWHALRRHLSRTGADEGLWPALAAYLTERRLSDSYDDPMTLTEAASLVPAHQLLGKTTRVLHDLLGELRQGPQQLKDFAAWFPTSETGGRNSVRSRIAIQFTDHGRAVVYPKLNGRMPLLMVFMGIWGPPRATETHIGVWLETDPRHDRLRQQVLVEARRLGLPGNGWQEHTRAGEWPLLSSSEPLAAGVSSEGGVTHEHARDALRLRVGELLDSGMLAYILRHWQDYQSTATEDESDAHS